MDDNIAEFLFRNKAFNIPSEEMSDLFNHLTWIMKDNGAQILDTMRTWICSGNLARATIAARVNVMYLYNNRMDMIEDFNKLCNRYPQLREICDFQICEWDYLNSSKLEKN